MKWPVVLFASVVLCAVLLLSRSEAKSYEEFVQKVKELRKANLSPECKKILRKCAGRLFVLWPLLRPLKKKWDDFQNATCVKAAFAEGFPNFDWPCTQGGNYEKSIKCMLSDDVSKLFGTRGRLVKTASKCLLDNI
ncbi:uncharacterized protein LOC144096925 [Amblyomma americanum]